MKSIFIDCSLGISGDMLASAFFNLGVPHSIFLDNLVSLNIDKIHFYKILKIKLIIIFYDFSTFIIYLLLRNRAYYLKILNQKLIVNTTNIKTNKMF